MRRFIKLGEQRGVGDVEPLDHGLRPPHIAGASFARPVLGRARGKIVQVRDLVGDLDEPCLLRAVGCMLNLELLAAKLRQALVVGQLFDQGGNDFSESLRELRSAGVGILDSIVEQRCGEDGGLGDAGVDQQCGHRDRVVDVGGLSFVLATLATVLVGGERQRIDLLTIETCYGSRH